MGSGDIPSTLPGDNPAMDQHPVQGRVAILLGILHVKETGISSGQGTCKIMLAITKFRYIEVLFRLFYFPWGEKFVFTTWTLL